MNWVVKRRRSLFLLSALGALLGLSFLRETQGYAAIGGVPVDPSSSSSSGAPPPPTVPPVPTRFSLGAVLATNSSGWQAIIPNAPTARGALVLAVLPQSAAANRLGVGDVIVAVDDSGVTDADEATFLLRSSAASTHRISVVASNTQSRSVTVTLGPLPVSVSKYLAVALAERSDPLARYLLSRNIPDAQEGIRLAQLLTSSHPDFAEGYAVEAVRRFDGLSAIRSPEAARDSISAIFSALGNAMQRDPESAEIRASAAHISLELGNGDLAIQFANEALQRDPNAASGQSILGLAELAKGMPDQAVGHLHRAVELDPFNAAYYEDLIRGYDAIGDGRSSAATSRVLEALRRGSESRSSNSKSLPVMLAVLSVVVVVTAFAGFGWADEFVRFLTGAPSGIECEGTESSSQLSISTLGLLESAIPLGAFAAVVPYLGSALGIASEATWKFRLAYHLLPGGLVVVAAVMSVVGHLRGELAVVRRLWLALVFFLVGLWMFAIHVPLIISAAQHEKSWVLVLFHGGASVGLLADAVLLWVTSSSGRPREALSVPLVEVPQA